HVTVAVVDSGIDYTPQLAGRVSRTDLTGGGGAGCIPHGPIVAGNIAAGDAPPAGGAVLRGGAAAGVASLPGPRAGGDAARGSSGRKAPPARATGFAGRHC